MEAVPCHSLIDWGSVWRMHVSNKLHKSEDEGEEAEEGPEQASDSDDIEAVPCHILIDWGSVCTHVWYNKYFSEDEGEEAEEGPEQAEVMGFALGFECFNAWLLTQRYRKA